MEKIIRALVTLCGLGFLPLWPGTWASIAAVGIFLLVGSDLGGYLLITSSLIVLGFILCGEAQEIFKTEDPKQVVIDEAAGMMVALFMVPVKWPYILAAFALFRVFDIIKPPPAKMLEARGDGIGIMGDDLVAGVYANILVHLGMILASKIGL